MSLRFSVNDIKLVKYLAQYGTSKKFRGEPEGSYTTQNIT